MRTRFTRAQSAALDEEIRRLASAGYCQPEIAMALRVTPRTIRDHAHQAGIKVPATPRGARQAKRMKLNKDRRTAERLAKQGWKDYDIAREIQRPIKMVKQWTTRAGLLTGFEAVRDA